MHEANSGGTAASGAVSESLDMELEAAQARLGFVIALTDGIVFELDEEGRYLGIWTRAPELLAVPREVALGRTMSEIFGPQAAEPFLQRMRHTLETGQPDRFEYSLKVASGLRWFSAEATRVPNRRTVVFLMRDITQQKLLEQRLIQADRLAAMGTLAAGVAHEVNNPLSYVSSNVNFVSEGVESLRAMLKERRGEAELARMRQLLDECLEALAEAQEGTTRIRHLAGNLKTFARGQDEGQGQVDVQRALESSLELAMRELSHRARVVKHLEQVPPVSGSQARLEQVFLNLLLNAAQAIAEGAREANQVELRLFPVGGMVVAEIRDTGAGMPEERVKRVFDPFFSTRPVGRGTGLGLSVSHGIITRMGGDISVESSVGRGTCFRVRLPVLPESHRAECLLPSGQGTPASPT